MPLRGLNGRPPKPIEKQRLLGNPGQHKLPAPIVLPATYEVPALPHGLKRDGRTFWTRAGEIPWISARSDWPIVELLARAYDEMALLRRVIAKEGRFIAGRNGLTTHPAVDQLRKIEEYVTKWLSLCGMTPTDKSRLGISEMKAVSKLEAFLGKQDGHAG